MLTLATSAASAQHGIASVYGGGRTSSGQWASPHGLTAAHRSLPFGTRVRVRNIRNGRSVVVTIDDRGPFRRGRIIDLTPAGAHELGMGWGLAPVEVEVVSRSAVWGHKRHGRRYARHFRHPGPKLAQGGATGHSVTVASLPPAAPSVPLPAPRPAPIAPTPAAPPKFSETPVGRGLVRVQTAAGPIVVAASVAARFAGLIADFVAHGYRPSEIGCYSPTGHVPHSLHHTGEACDFNQTGWNATDRFMYTAEAHRLILAHGLRDGCDFRHPRKDCGHVDDGRMGHVGYRYASRHTARRIDYAVNARHARWHQRRRYTGI